MFLIYSLLMGLAALALTPYWLVQNARHGKYLSNLGQRLGFSFPELNKRSTSAPSSTIARLVAAARHPGCTLSPSAKVLSSGAACARA